MVLFQSNECWGLRQNSNPHQKGPRTFLVMLHRAEGVVVTYSAHMTLYLSAFYRLPEYLGKTEPCAWGMRSGAGVGLCLPQPPEEEEENDGHIVDREGRRDVGGGRAAQGSEQGSHAGDPNEGRTSPA